VTRRTSTEARALCVVVGLALLVAGSAAAQTATPAPLKIAFINGRQILQQTPGYAAAESTFNKEVQGYGNEVRRLETQLDSAVRAFEMAGVALSPTAKAARQKELQTMQQHLQQRQDELRQKAQQREAELIQPIQARVNAVIQGLRAEGNYAFILDAESAGSTVVAADPALDVTSQVLERLRHSQ